MQLNNFQRDLINYIKVKYPRGQKTIEDDELANIFE